MFFYRFLKVSLLVLFFYYPASCPAKTVGPVDFVETKDIKGTQLILNGAGLKKFINFKVVAVALYLPKGEAPQNVLNEIPKHLEVVYLLSIPKAELDRATEHGIQKNVDPLEFKRLKSRIEQMNSYYQDVTNGDRIGVSYLPPTGTIVSFNGRVRGIVKGEDFARAFFSIWIGNNPVDKIMKRKLLGGVND